MKKCIIILVVILNVIFFCTTANANNQKMNTFELITIENESNPEYELYILLPEEYIQFAIKNDKLKLEYDGANTLKNNDIPSIEVEKQYVQDQVYILNNIEYTKILLKPDYNGKYTFNILSNYKEMDIKYMLKQDLEEYILHIDNFKIEKNKCKIEYDFNNKRIKQPDETIITLPTILLIVVLIIVIILGVISYIKQRSR